MCREPLRSDVVWLNIAAFRTSRRGGCTDLAAIGRGAVFAVLVGRCEGVIARLLLQ